jgi:SAM-dependent methyltransferase
LRSRLAKNQSKSYGYAAKARWYAGIYNELEWHEQWLATEADKSLIDRLCDPLQPIRDHVVVKCIEDRINTHEVKILEIGAGPISYVGYTYPHKTVQLTPTDALGREYCQMLNYIGIHPPIRTLPCSGEEVAMCFAENYFDIGYASNALDHTNDPIQIIRNMLAVTKQGGTVILRHFVNESDGGNYEGLHQWNFDISNDEPVMWNRVHRHSLVNEFSQSAKIEAFIEPSKAFGFFAWNDWVVVTLTKR